MSSPVKWYDKLLAGLGAGFVVIAAAAFTRQLPPTVHEVTLMTRREATALVERHWDDLIAVASGAPGATNGSDTAIIVTFRPCRLCRVAEQTLLDSAQRRRVGLTVLVVVLHMPEFAPDSADNAGCIPTAQGHKTRNEDSLEASVSCENSMAAGTYAKRSAVVSLLHLGGMPVMLTHTAILGPGFRPLVH